jgi:catechol 2,3-dioxygenase-like lactoylglutathione lyase family enzyme
MRAFVVVTTILGVLLASSAGAAQNQIPPDFRVIAHFGSGHIPVTYDDPARGQVGAWYVRLDAHGVAKVEVFRNSPGKKTKTSVRYSAAELQRIKNVIADSRFFELPAWLNGGLSDVPGYSLEVTMGGKTHKVGVIAPGAFRDKKLLKRFTSVWVAVCSKMPPKLDDGVTRDLQERS